MKILNELLSILPKDPIPVRKVIIGVHWTLVASKYSGLASTMVGQEPHGHSRVRDVGLLHEKTAQELASWILSDNLLEASIGMATVNSLLEVDEQQLEQVNAAEVIEREGKGKNLAIIGHFPFVDQMKTIARNCWVIEKRPFGEDFPEEASREYLPQADVVAITGTTLINHTLEGLLSLCRPGSRIMILGPSTPMTPLLFNYGVSYISGSRIIDEHAAIATIQQGAIFPQVKGTRLLIMTKRI